MASQKHAITPTRANHFAEWYQEVIKAADLAEHSVVRGCMIIKPWGYALWEHIQSVLDQMIKATGHDNVYFPMLIPLSFLQKEAAHVEGFAKECAVVTHYRLETDSSGQLAPAPDAKLTEAYIIRPTSETIIGDAMASWIQTYKDLPIKINQWANVMRWEMRTRLFLRTSEFLWQEGHTAHAIAEEAMQETLTMLDVYEKLATDYLAIPVIKGEKTAGERFPGAVHTYCIEAMMQDGKALQAGTSHFLGQNFAQANEIKYSDKTQKECYAWTTSWGVSTRLIGALIMVHSDDDGLALPPRIAPKQIILIPVAMNDEDLARVMQYCEELSQTIHTQNYFGSPIRIAIDKTDQRAGVKFWTAVKKGIPIRVEVGIREIEADLLSISLRQNSAKEKQTMSRATFVAECTKLLDSVHNSLFDRALEYRVRNTVQIFSLNELEALYQNNEQQQSKFALAYFDLSLETDPTIEALLKKLKLTIRCIPFSADVEKGSCIFSKHLVSTQVIFARSY